MKSSLKYSGHHHHHDHQTRRRRPASCVTISNNKPCMYSHFGDTGGASCGAKCLMMFIYHWDSIMGFIPPNEFFFFLNDHCKLSRDFVVSLSLFLELSACWLVAPLATPLLSAPQSPGCHRVGGCCECLVFSLCNLPSKLECEIWALDSARAKIRSNESKDSIYSGYSLHVLVVAAAVAASVYLEVLMLSMGKG